MDYEFEKLGLEKLSVNQVKSWLDRAETLEDLTVNPEKVREFAKLFYPTANYIYFQFGGEYNDSGYDLSITDIRGAIKTGNGAIEYLPVFDYYNYNNSYNDRDEYGKVSSTVCAKSLEELGYCDLSAKILERANRFGFSVDDLYEEFKYSMIGFNGREVSSEFSVDGIGFDLEKGQLDGIPEIPAIYGLNKDFSGSSK